MNWIKAQNKFSIDNRSIFGKYRRYRYYKGNTSYTYRMGAYRYSIDFQLKEEYFGKELTDDGIEHDGVSYFWHYFYESCSFEKDINFDWRPSIKENTFKIPKIKKGEWKYNNKVWANILNYIKEVREKLQKYRKLIVYFPYNRQIENHVQQQYNSKFISELKKERISFVVGNLDKINELEKKLIVIVVDIITNKERHKHIVNDIRLKRSEQIPVITYFSLMKIYDVEDCMFSKTIVLKERESETTVEEKHHIGKPVSTTKYSDYDDEELVMRSLMGLGPDPELFGF